MSKQTSKRKAEHIAISLKKNVQAMNATTGFEDITFIHRALPEIDRKNIDLSTTVFGHKFAAPIIVGAITGGTDKAGEINATIAEAVEKLGLGMGVGSQRAALEDKKFEATFSVARKKAPSGFLIANIGGIQLVNGYTIREVRRAVEMIDADALAVHLNALQEAAQPEGQTNFQGVLEHIHEVSGQLDKPVIAKETGAGIAASEAIQLQEAGVKGIDVSGVGGTSFAAVEHYRKIHENTAQHRLGEVFWDWGIPTVASIIEVSNTVEIPVIASGGVRNGLDVAKSLALGANLASFSQPVLKCAMKGVKETCDMLSSIVDEVRTAMFLLGTRSVDQLSEAPLVLTGRTAEWMNARGFDLKKYAQRGK